MIHVVISKHPADLAYGEHARYYRLITHTRPYHAGSNCCEVTLKQRANLQGYSQTQTWLLLPTHQYIPTKPCEIRQCTAVHDACPKLPPLEPYELV